MAFVTITNRSGNIRSGRGPIREQSVAIGLSEKKGKHNQQLNIRLSGPVMKASRLLAGDLVEVLYDSDSKLCLIRRNVKGYRLSPCGNSTKKETGTPATSAVRFTHYGSPPIKECGLTECENISINDEGVLFSLPESILI